MATQQLAPLVGNDAARIGRVRGTAARHESRGALGPGGAFRRVLGAVHRGAAWIARSVVDGGGGPRLARERGDLGLRPHGIGRGYAGPRVHTRTGRLLPFTLLLPSIVFLAVLIVIPMGQALLLSFATDSGGFSLENFRRMLADVTFSDAWRNTFLLLVLIVPLQVALALAMALLVNSRFRGHRWFFLIYTIPLAVSDLAAGLLWLAALTARGYLNSVLTNAGAIGQPGRWLTFGHFS